MKAAWNRGSAFKLLASVLVVCCPIQQPGGINHRKLFFNDLRQHACAAGIHFYAMYTLFCAARQQCGLYACVTRRQLGSHTTRHALFDRLAATIRCTVLAGLLGAG